MESIEQKTKYLEESSNPLENTNFIERLFFLWILPIVKVF